ncbi:MAG: purine-nucleoside phosphorylase [Longimonas sp.]|uniref:purine-nucleoside phosphorylase n=1 Tax=Longimonas sp. TaxID=2039626 RepID=UPI0033626FB4
MAASVLDPDTHLAHVNTAAEAVRALLSDRPRIGIIADPVTEPLVEEMTSATAIDFADVPHLPAPGETDAHRFIAGELWEQDVLVVPHALHLYEGISARESALPVRIMGALGIETLIATAAAGSVNPHYTPGEVMLLADHINLQGANPLEGPNVDAWGPRFPDMSNPYDPALREVAHQAALRAGERLQEGIYLGVPGPNTQTKTEYRFMRHVGADAVGTGLIPEVIAARHMDLRVLAAVVITDACFADTLEPTSAAEVAQAAETGRARLKQVLTHLMPRL